VAAVPANDWEQPSPCAGWTARDVVRHLVEWFPEFLTAAGGPMLTPGPNVDNDPLGAWRHLDAQVQALLDNPSASAATVSHPRAGEHRLDTAIDMFFRGDVFLHTWDLSRATGQDEHLDEAMAAEMLAGMEPIAEQLAASGQYSPRVEVDPDASVQERLLAVSGRHR